MATSFPTGLDAIQRVVATDLRNAPGKEGHVLHNNLCDAVEALQAKVGVNGSAVPGSIDKRLAETIAVSNAALVATSQALGSLVASSAEESNPDVSDQVLLSDTSASGIAKKVSWSRFQKMARAQARRPWRFRGKLLADGSSLTGWTPQSNVTLSVVAKPAGGLSTYRSNGESVMRIATVGEYKSATANVVTGPVGNPRVDFWVYLENPTTIVDLPMYFATSDDFSSYYLKTVQVRAFVGWQCVSVDLATATVVGSPTYETITRFRIQVHATTSAGSSILFDAAFISPHAQSKCALIWDDGLASDYTHTLPLLNKYELLGNFAVYDTPARIEQWRMMAHSGHRIIVHGTTNLSTLGTLQAAKNDILANAAWVAALDGPGCDPDVYVWPNGVFMYSAGSLALPQFLADEGFVGGFATADSPIIPEPGIDRYILHRLEIGPTTVAATWLTALDAYLNAGLCFALCAHDTVDSGATGIQVNRAVLDDILAGIRTRINAGSLECVSARDLILHLTEQ